MTSCPQCHSTSFDRAGFRYLTSEKPVQRFLCKNCGYRFSQHNSFNSNSAKTSGSQVGASIEVINLALPTTELKIAGSLHNKNEEKVIEYLQHLQRQNASLSTQRTFSSLLHKLINNHGDLMNPDNVKDVLVKLNATDNTKALMVTAYSSFLKYHAISWLPPKYTRPQTIPWIPTETMIDALISGTTQPISTLLLLLKHTGMRIGEAVRLQYTDVNAPNRTISVNFPEKGSNTRIIKVPQQVIDCLYSLPKSGGGIFGQFQNSQEEMAFRQNKEACLNHHRKRLARKLGTPELNSITFHTLRHWKGTIEYHETKDIIHVQYLLGHRNIQNTLRYIHMEQAIFKEADDKFHVKVAGTLDEATKLLEVGYEFVTDMDGKKLFRKRK
jgi:integrase